MASPHVEVPAEDAFEQRLQDREHLRNRPLEMVPDQAARQPHGGIPNTPLAISIISLLLGTTFALGSLTFLCGGFSAFWFATYQVGFFVASWSAFHWGEFAVTAGWNREKVSVDCAYVLFWSPAWLSIRSISPQQRPDVSRSQWPSVDGIPTSSLLQTFVEVIPVCVATW